MCRSFDPGPGEIRVAVAAATVNPTDLGVAAGFFHSTGLIDQPEHTGLGWEFAAVVEAGGPGVDWAVGTRVAGLVTRLRPRLGNLRRADRCRSSRRHPRPRGAGPAGRGHRSPQRAGRCAGRRSAWPRARRRRRPAAGDWRRGGGRSERHRPRPASRLAGDRARPHR
ncbi:alcohol dehydrogenase catalytic domain-containing protein [Streptomyces sp. NPDC057806]|uniref:alcohol dehydrogenase catalytic domain-containing protein n=1 Tax=Streptomyces sp. NPDC057806 TaxID=3346255 RepID=UPI0036BF03BD